MHTRPKLGLGLGDCLYTITLHLLHSKDDFPFKKQYKEALNMILHDTVFMTVMYTLEEPMDFMAITLPSLVTYFKLAESGRQNFKLFKTEKGANVFYLIMFVL